MSVFEVDGFTGHCNVCSKSTPTRVAQVVPVPVSNLSYSLIEVAGCDIDLAVANVHVRCLIYMFCPAVLF